MILQQLMRMNIMNKVIKVVFLLKKNSPVNLKLMQYYVATGNYTVAHDKALEKLNVDVKKHCLRYFDGVAMSEIELI